MRRDDDDNNIMLPELVVAIAEITLAFYTGKSRSALRISDHGKTSEYYTLGALPPY
jgi:hypothetical protein